MKSITLRPAEPGDSRILWTWRNAPDVRATAFQTAPIPWPDHEEWFQRKLQDPNTFIYVAEGASGQPVGQIRFDARSREAEVSVVVDPSVRGRGIGTHIIRLGTQTVLASGAVDIVTALVKVENEASIQAFEKAGYEQIGGGEVEVEGHAAVRLRRVNPVREDRLSHGRGAVDA